jgi:hypothetical protein
MHARRRPRANWNPNHARRPRDRCRSWANPSTAENSVGRSFPPRRRWLRSDLSATEFSVAGLVRCAGRSRLDGRSRQRAGSSGLRWCALKAQGQISPGQSVAPPRVVVANGSGSPEGARQADASIVSPLQGFFAAMDTLPRATATLAQLASPCPGLICRAPSGQRRPKRKKTCSSSRETESSRRWLARIGFPDAGREKNACHCRGGAVG